MKNSFFKLKLCVLILLCPSLLFRTNAQTEWKITCILENAHKNLFIGTTNGYILSSSDYGLSWNSVLKDSLARKVMCLAANKKGDIFAGFAGAGIMRSEDDGENWDVVKPNSYQPGIGGIAIDTSNNIFAGTYDGLILRSLDNGNTWNDASKGLDVDRVKSLVIDSKNRIFAGTCDALTVGGIVYRSFDNGDTWESSSTSGFGWLAVYSVGVGSNDAIFAKTKYGTFKSSNSGDSWKQVSNYNIGPFFLFSKDTIYGCGVNNIYYSIDNGDNWQTIPASNTGSINAIFVTSERKILVGSDSGLFYSTNNGLNWTEFAHVIPDIPTLLLPLNESIQPLSLSLEWNVSNNADSYEIQVSNFENFNILVGYKISITSTNYNITDLINETKYYWRVNATNAFGTSNWSEIWDFTASNTVGMNSLASKNKISYYPNPVSDCLFIEPNTDEIIHISIYSIDGKLLKQNDINGINNISLSDLNSGLYLLKIDSSKTLILDKLIKK